MRHQLSSALPETGPPPNPEASRRLVERVAIWSMRHRKTVVIGWLVVIAVVFVAGHMAGTSAVPSNDPGQSGVAEATLERLHVSQPPSEGVLIQARGSVRTDPQLRRATGDVVRAMSALPYSTASAIRSPFGGGSGGRPPGQLGSSSLISADGR